MTFDGQCVCVGGGGGHRGGKKAHDPTRTRRGRNQHSLAFQIPSASKDVYKYSFFPQTIRNWNDLPESLISSSELSDDSVSKFTSLVRARDQFPPVTSPGEGLSIWRFTSKLFRFRAQTQLGPFADLLLLYSAGFFSISHWKRDFSRAG